MTPILALDLATTTGWARLTDQGEIAHGFAKLAHRTAVERIRALEDLLRDHLPLVAHGKGDLVYETPVTSGRTYPASVRVACHLEATLLGQAFAFGVDPDRIYGVAPAELKKWTTGNGNAPKELMVATVEERWGLGITDDNEADAVALLKRHEATRA